MMLAATEVTSTRHLPSWMLLAFGAGSVNTIAFLACQRFVAHVTGIVTRIGMDVGEWVLLLDYAIVLACFVLGAVTSTVIVKRGRREDVWRPLALVTTTLVGAGIAGHLGAFGPFGGSVESGRDFALLSILAFAMGTQNAVGALRSGMAVRTTHLTGPCTDLAIGLGTMLASSGPQQREPLPGVIMRAAKLASFAAGAAVAVPLARHAGFSALLLPALASSVAMVASFVTFPLDLERSPRTQEPR